MTPWTAATLAEWTLDLDTGDLPDAVIAKAEDCLIDALACALAGRDAKGTLRVMAVASAQYRDGPADVWFSTDRLHPTGAAFVNSTAVSILTWTTAIAARSATRGRRSFRRPWPWPKKPTRAGWSCWPPSSPATRSAPASARRNGGPLTIPATGVASARRRRRPGSGA